MTIADLALVVAAYVLLGVAAFVASRRQLLWLAPLALSMLTFDAWVLLRAQYRPSDTVDSVRVNGDRLAVCDVSGPAFFTDAKRLTELDVSDGHWLSRTVAPAANDAEIALDASFFEAQGETGALVVDKKTIALKNMRLADAHFLCQKCFEDIVKSYGLRDPDSVLIEHSDGGAYALSRVTFAGERLWTLTLAQLGGVPNLQPFTDADDRDRVWTLAKGTLFLGVGGEVIAIDARSGAVKWRSRL